MEMERVEGGKNTTRMHYGRENSIFNKRWGEKNVSVQKVESHTELLTVSRGLIRQLELGKAYDFS